MISAWWLIPVITISMTIGAVLMGCLCANDQPSRKKWWEDE